MSSYLRETRKKERKNNHNSRYTKARIWHWPTQL